MLQQKLNPMHPVPQPSRHLANAYWDILEIQLLAAMLGAAAEQQAAAGKGRAL
jgi:hypothetical protein